MSVDAKMEIVYTCSTRNCSSCKEPIEVGKSKCGRTVFKGGICYSCWVRAGKPGRAKK